MCRVVLGPGWWKLCWFRSKSWCADYQQIHVCTACGQRGINPCSQKQPSQAAFPYNRFSQIPRPAACLLPWASSLGSNSCPLFQLLAQLVPMGRKARGIRISTPTTFHCYFFLNLPETSSLSSCHPRAQRDSLVAKSSPFTLWDPILAPVCVPAVPLLIHFPACGLEKQ